jgi:hypothetical protein
MYDTGNCYIYMYTEKKYDKFYIFTTKKPVKI